MHAWRLGMAAVFAAGLAACAPLPEKLPPRTPPVAEAPAAAAPEPAAAGFAVPQPAAEPAASRPELLEPVPASAEDRFCLAQTIYFEARGEPATGQRAVAAVVLNRVRHPDFPDEICAVVRQGGERPLGRCQFSWWCDGRSDEPRPGPAWQQAVHLAEELTTERHRGFDGALYFHSVRIRPAWSYRLERVARIGDHIYYR